MIQVTHDIRGANNQDHVLSTCSKWCDEDLLVFPIQVFAELSQYKRHDRLSTWAMQIKKKACRFGPCHEQLVDVMRHPVSKGTVDSKNSSSKEESAPHVLATVLKVITEPERTLIVMTDESTKKTPFIPLNVAANALEFISHYLCALLLISNVWKDDVQQVSKPVL